MDSWGALVPRTSSSCGNRATLVPGWRGSSCQEQSLGKGLLAGLDVGGIPARPFLGVSDQDRRDIQDLVIGQLEDLLQ